MEWVLRLNIIRVALALLALGCGLFIHLTDAQQDKGALFWMQIRAHNAKERTQISNLGVAIEMIREDYVAGTGTARERKILEEKGLVIRAYPVDGLLRDFPQEDERFHNYQELTTELQQLVRDNPNLVRMDSIGKSVEGKDIWHLAITSYSGDYEDRPAIVFMGGHHAREHLSVEIPFLIAHQLIKLYNDGDSEVRRLLNSRMVHIIPVVNPDGKEHDIGNGSYRYWRKNRAVVNNQKIGVDLNRNYATGWGGPGSSPDPYSETYRGPSAFSEPETQTIQRFVESHKNLNILASIHTYSELILYPWGHTDDKIPNERDLAVHKKMAETMAGWNGYKPMQSAELYLASGDTTDWAYKTHGLISFTFELDPTSFGGGGFYPGQEIIDSVLRKNWRPALYLIDYADNPYRVLDAKHVQYGLNSPLVQ